MNQKINKVQLPMKAPLITSYTSCASLLAVIQNNEQSIPWIFNQFVQLMGRDFDGDPKNYIPPSYYKALLFEECPFIQLQKLDRAFVKVKWTTFTELIMESIESGYYLYFEYDQYDVPGTWAYQKHHNMHQMLCFGYDNDTQMLDIADFFNHIFEHRKLPYATIERAYQNFVPSSNYWCFSDIYVFKPKCFGDFVFSKEYLQEALYELLYSQNSWKNVRTTAGIFYSEAMDQTYGMETQYLARDYIQARIKQPGNVSVKLLGVLYDHKTMMVERIKFLLQNEYIDEDSDALEGYLEVKEIFRSILYLPVKYNALLRSQKVSNDLLEKISERLFEATVKEKKALRVLINELKDFRYVGKCIPIRTSIK